MDFTKVLMKNSTMLRFQRIDHKQYLRDKKWFKENPGKSHRLRTPSTEEKSFLKTEGLIESSEVIIQKWATTKFSKLIISNFSNLPFWQGMQVKAKNNKLIADIETIALSLLFSKIINFLSSNSETTEAEKFNRTLQSLFDEATLLAVMKGASWDK